MFTQPNLTEIAKRDALKRFRFNFNFVTFKRPDPENPKRMIDMREPTASIDLLAMDEADAINRFRGMTETNFHFAGEI